MPTLADGPIAAMLFALLLVIVVLYVRWSRRNVRASAERIKKYQLPPDKDAVPASTLESPPGGGRWEIQMHDLARDLIGQLDSKIAILNGLLRTAEERIVRLEQAIEQSGGVPPSPPVSEEQHEKP
jgi:hypothetical protein